jgi:hypothetical protein
MGAFDLRYRWTFLSGAVEGERGHRAIEMGAATPHVQQEQHQP